MSFQKTTSHDPVSKLVFELSKLPGIGDKSATRLAYYILRQDRSYAKALSEAIENAVIKMSLCKECYNFTSEPICSICSSTDRDSETICVVEQPSDVFSVDRSGHFKGKFHVLHGVLSPLDGIGPEDLKIRELFQRLQSEVNPVKEVILATNPSVEGEATSLYLSKMLKGTGIKITKLAYGIPVGGLLEFTDQQTIHRALENRIEVQP
tara:strand:- start:1370 stop:1993 length:624 start_codon:yes stop_codon:yes gene_type:complete